MSHSYASQLAGLGVPLGVTQALMGHADPMTTQRVYTHTLDGQLEDAAARQAAAIRTAATRAQAGRYDASCKTAHGRHTVCPQESCPRENALQICTMPS